MHVIQGSARWMRRPKGVHLNLGGGGTRCSDVGMFNICLRTAIVLTGQQGLCFCCSQLGDRVEPVVLVDHCNGPVARVVANHVAGGVLEDRAALRRRVVPEEVKRPQHQIEHQSAGGTEGALRRARHSTCAGQHNAEKCEGDSQIKPKSRIPPRELPVRKYGGVHDWPGPRCHQLGVPLDRLGRIPTAIEMIDKACGLEVSRGRGRGLVVQVDVVVVFVFVVVFDEIMDVVAGLCPAQNPNPGDPGSQPGCNRRDFELWPATAPPWSWGVTAQAKKYFFP